MTDARVGQRRRTSAEIPEIVILSGCHGMQAQPVTIFEVGLIAGDTAGAVLTISTGSSRESLVVLEAQAGGRSRFVPAAPVYIRKPMHIAIVGDDAVGSVAFR